jgi:hypothetical protein
MPKGLPQAAKDHLDKCKASAIAAVDVYNRPGPRFRTAHYVVLIVMAWTALLHAIYYKRRVNPWYKRKGKNSKGDRYERVDGDPKHWELSECLKQLFGGNNPPERKNLEFLIGLRNKIEHRHLPQLDAGLYGECQAALLNLENLINTEFGPAFSISEQLAVALQCTGVVPAEKKKAAKAVATAAAKSVKSYVETFRGGLPSSTLNSTKYSFNVFLVPKVVNKKDLADASVTFVKVDEGNRDEVERLEKLNVLIKEKHIPISNLGLHKPSMVVEAVNAKLPHRFSMTAHSRAWRHYKVRPAGDAAKPYDTLGQYCIYDKPHNDYLYTDAWIAKLITDLINPTQFATVTGFSPESK